MLILDEADEMLNKGKRNFCIRKFCVAFDMGSF